MDAALDFFCRLLGMRVTFDRVHDPSIIGALTGYSDPDVRAAIVEAPDGTEFELAEFRRPRGRSTVEHEWCDVGINFITLRVEQLDDLVARLRDSGVAFTGPPVEERLPDGAVNRVVYCFGPGGITICLAELPRGRRILGIADRLPA
jgi:catechol 2,3-dioxygenase-like lactoylglutathione lyase family enzyme